MFNIPCQMVQKLMWKTKRISPNGPKNVQKKDIETKNVIYGRHPPSQNYLFNFFIENFFNRKRHCQISFLL